MKVKGIGGKVAVDSTSSRAARRNELTFEQCPFTGTIWITDEGKGNRVDPGGVHSCPYRTTVEAVGSACGQVIQAIVGDETTRAKQTDRVGP